MNPADCGIRQRCAVEGSVERQAGLRLPTRHHGLLTGGPLLMFVRCLTVAVLAVVCGCTEKASTEMPSSSPRPSAVVTSQSASPERASSPGKPLIIDGKVTAYWLLGDGSLVRSEAPRAAGAEGCPSQVPRRATCESKGPSGAASGCKADVDCKEKPHGHCSQDGLDPSCGCSYGCVSDAECGSGRVCVCAEPVGYCADSACGPEGCGKDACLASPLATDLTHFGPFRCAPLPE